MQMETCKMELSAQINPSNFIRASTLPTGVDGCCSGMLRRANMKPMYKPR